MQASFINTVLIIAKLSYYYNAVLVRNSPFDAHYWKAEALILVSILKSRIIVCFTKGTVSPWALVISVEMLYLSWDKRDLWWRLLSEADFRTFYACFLTLQNTHNNFVMCPSNRNSTSMNTKRWGVYSPPRVVGKLSSMAHELPVVFTLLNMEEVAITT